MILSLVLLEPVSITTERGNATNEANMIMESTEPTMKTLKSWSSTYFIHTSIKRKTEINCFWEKRTFADDVIDSVNWWIVHFRNFCAEIRGTLQVLSSLCFPRSLPVSCMRSYRSIFFVFPGPRNFNFYQLFQQWFSHQFTTQVDCGVQTPYLSGVRISELDVESGFPGHWIPSKILRLASGFLILLHGAKLFLLSS